LQTEKIPRRKKPVASQRPDKLFSELHFPKAENILTYAAGLLPLTKDPVPKSSSLGVRPSILYKTSNGTAQFNLSLLRFGLLATSLSNAEAFTSPDKQAKFKDSSSVEGFGKQLSQ